jgi:hypothetical protein
METFDNAEVTQTDEGASGFQLTFKVGRNRETGRDEYKALADGHFKLFNRAIISVKIDSKTYVLMDGIIIHHQLNPSNEPGMSTMTITGEDVSVMMDLEEKVAPHPNQSQPTIVRAILDNHRDYIGESDVQTPPAAEAPPKEDFVHQQRESDLAYVRRLAKEFGWDFYVLPTENIGTSKAYWGPKVRNVPLQPAISVNMKQGGNADSVNFTFDGLGPTKIKDIGRDRRENKDFDVTSDKSEVPDLTKEPATTTVPNVRVSLMEANPGLSRGEAIRQAQAEVDKSIDKAAGASGQLNGFRYRAALQARGLVGVRGAGEICDGQYYVKSVTHKLRRGEYTQSFTLTREGAGTTKKTLPTTPP